MHFTAERSNFYHVLVKAEDLAKAQKLKASPLVDPNKKTIAYQHFRWLLFFRIVVL